MNTFQKVFPQTMKKYIRHLRLNGKIVKKGLGEIVDNGYYQNGLVAKRNDEGDITIVSTTIENGGVTMNFRAMLDSEGKLINGIVNCFTLGYINMDQGYIDEYIKEIAEKLEDGEEYFDVKKDYE